MVLTRAVGRRSPQFVAERGHERMVAVEAAPLVAGERAWRAWRYLFCGDGCLTSRSGPRKTVCIVTEAGCVVTELAAVEITSGG